MSPMVHTGRNRPAYAVKEMVMEHINQPSKEEVREWLKERQALHTPPPDAAQIRLALGWKLMKRSRRLGLSATEDDLRCNGN